MSDWQSIARAAARKYHIDEDIFAAQMGQEAHGEDLTSGAGAQGPAQIMPATAAAWGVKNVHDIHQAYDAAASHMAQYRDQFGNMQDALVAYNAGPGKVGQTLPAETANYIKTIMGAAKSGGMSSNPATNSAYNAAVRRVTGGPLQSSGTTVTAPNLFSQIGAQAPVNVAGTSPQLQQLQQTTAKNWSMMGSIQDSLMNAANRRIDAPSSPISTADPASSADVVGDGADQPTGVGDFEGTKVASWIAPILAYARENGWKGGVNSGWRSLAEQTKIYNSGVRPAAKPGTSNHEGTDFPRGAVDVSEAAQLAEILKRSKYAQLLQWAGDKDPVHFSHPHNGSY